MVSEQQWAAPEVRRGVSASDQFVREPNEEQGKRERGITTKEASRRNEEVASNCGVNSVQRNGGGVEE